MVESTRLETQYWLQPGMEDVMQTDMKLSVTSGGTLVGTTLVPNTLDQLTVGQESIRPGVWQLLMKI